MSEERRKIVICTSMSVARQILQAREFLEKKGYVCVIPEGTQEYASGKIAKTGGSEGAKRKIQGDLIRGYFKEISRSQAILVLNYRTHGIEGYVGGNVLMEVGFAHILRKKIYFMFDLPVTAWNRQELEAVEPTILRGNLDLLE